MLQLPQSYKTHNIMPLLLECTELKCNFTNTHTHTHIYIYTHVLYIDVCFVWVWNFVPHTEEKAYAKDSWE